MFNKKRSNVLRILTLFILIATVLMFTACGKKDSGIAVTAMEVTGAQNVSTIETLGGTLQMTAAVTPANATNKNVTWTIVDGTGNATVSVSGLVTALTNGTVTVTAASVSNKTVKGSKQLTITNQVNVAMDATLTALTIDGIAVMGFTPLTNDYAKVLSDEVTATPVVVATKYASSATVVIVPAADVTSSVEQDRITTITVTSGDGVSVRVYSVQFETAIHKVGLRSAGDYVILGVTGISTASTSAITGNIAVCPAPATYITGFALTIDATETFSTSSQITGSAFAFDYAAPTPGNLINAFGAMGIAYLDAGGRSSNYNELFAGDLSSKTLTTGVYKWGTSAKINTDLTLSGSATDVWIFQISGGLTMAVNTKIVLAGGALAENVFWQVSNTVAMGADAEFAGVVLGGSNISLGTNASVNGQLFAQTAVTLDANIIVKP